MSMLYDLIYIYKHRSNAYKNKQIAVLIRIRMKRKEERNFFQWKEELKKFVGPQLFS